MHSNLSALEAELPVLRGKDRLDALMKIADLQQMKREENQPEEEKIHYYLPLEICKNCPNRKNLGRKEWEATEKTGEKETTPFPAQKRKKAENHHILYTSTPDIPFLPLFSPVETLSYLSGYCKIIP